jgi:ABC-2 type transport system ATP-binding protein
VIQAQGLCKRYGATTALADVSFTVGRGEVVGFLGPNGAGKTTTLRILAGFLPADAGRALIDGLDVARAPLAAQRRLGYLPEGAPLYDDMLVEDFLAHRARLKGAPRARVRDALAAARALDVAGRRIGQLSKGYRQRVGLADALVADPPILILDEPTAGLDPNQIREVRDLVRELARARTVLLSTHLLAEVEALAARVVVLVGGRVVADGRLEALRAAASGGHTLVEVAPVELAPALQAVAGEVLDGAAGRLRTALPVPDAARALVAAGVGVLGLRRESASLEELFAGLTAAGAPERAP